MIKITDVGGHEMFINIDLFEKIISTPDTLIFLLNGTKILVKETPDEIVRRIIDFRKQCNEKLSVEIINNTKTDSE